MMKQALLEKILDLEWDMFVRVRSDQHAPCQTAPDNFRQIRGSLFEMWPDAMLASYLDDLTQAWACGRNLLTEKYARMDQLIEPLSANPVIDKILEIENKWQAELQELYPALYRRCCRKMDPTGNGSNFSVYLRCELETYSDPTLALYYQNVKNAEDEKRNLAQDALYSLVRKSKYRDLAHAESCMLEMAEGGR